MGFFSNLFGRTGRVVRGQVNSGMDKVEDATFESTLKQTVRDMKTELNKVVRASAEAMSNHNRLEAEYQRYVRESEQWHERAKKALEAGNEDLARKALAKKGDADGEVQKMQASVDQAGSTKNMLKSRVQDLKRRIEEAERDAGTLIARKNAARAQRKVAEALSGVGEADNAFAAIKNFEESVARDEATAQAYDTMAEDPDSDLMKEFEKLDITDTDDELAALKREMNKS